MPIPFRTIDQSRLLDELQDVPEEQHHGREERERCGDVLVRPVVVQDVRGVVEDVATGEDDHRHREPHAQTEAEDHSAKDCAQRGESNDPQDPTQPGEVGFGEEDKRRQADEDQSGHQRRCGNHVGLVSESRIARDEEQRVKITASATT